MAQSKISVANDFSDSLIKMETSITVVNIYVNILNKPFKELLFIEKTNHFQISP